jgi:hypothetical protein
LSSFLIGVVDDVNWFERACIDMASSGTASPSLLYPYMFQRAAVRTR